MREQHLGHLEPVIRQVTRGRFRNTAGKEWRGEDDVCVSEGRGVDAVSEAEGVSAGGLGWGFAKGLGIGDGLEADDFGEGSWV